MRVVGYLKTNTLFASHVFNKLFFNAHNYYYQLSSCFSQILVGGAKTVKGMDFYVFKK